MGEFNLSEYTISREAKEIELPLSVCVNCNKTGLRPSCEDHSSALSKSVKIKVKQMSWHRKNQILSAALYWDADGNTRFRSEYYVGECLKAIVAEAPWGITSETFLSSIGNSSLSAALQTLIPSAFSTTDDDAINNLKKEL